jgi:hypothetical protein
VGILRILQNTQQAPIRVPILNKRIESFVFAVPVSINSRSKPKKNGEAETRPPART